MATPRAKVQKLVEAKEKLRMELQGLQRQMEALSNKIAGMELAIVLLEGGDAPSPESDEPRKRRESVKPTLIDLLSEVGTTGLNANTAVEIASRRGITLDRNTVSSLLSRLKRDSIVDFDGMRYRLREYSVVRHPSNESGPPH